MSKLKVGQRVRDNCTITKSTGQVGTVVDEDTYLVWVKFDNDQYNNATAFELDGQPRCTACIVKYLEPIEG